MLIKRILRINPVALQACRPCSTAPEPQPRTMYSLDTLRDHLSKARSSSSTTELTIDQPKNPKLVRIAILGLPNVGKSSLANALVGNQLLPVSRKVHTTRKLTTAVAVERETQMVFLDTPGVVSTRHKKQHFLSDSLLLDPEKSIPAADLIAVVVDVSDEHRNRTIDDRILYLLNRYRQKESILVLNKVDAIGDKTKLLEIMHLLTGGVVNGTPLPTKTETFAETKRSFGSKKDKISELMQKYHRHKDSPDSASIVPPKERTFDKNVHEISDIQLAKYFETKSWPYFEQVFMVTALHGGGIKDLRDYLVSKSSSQDWLYPDTPSTDQRPTELILQIVRSKLLDQFDGPLPYIVRLGIVNCDLSDLEILSLEVRLRCENVHWLKRLIGPKGQYTRKVSLAARQDISNLFQCDVHLKLIVAK